MMSRADRRALKLGRDRSGRTGFQPMRNQRIDAAIMGRTTIERLNNPLLSHGEAQQLAFDHVRRSLPPLPRGEKILRMPKPTKNNNPAYRKALPPAPPPAVKAKRVRKPKAVAA